jgi:ankyrin repeat protein
MVKFLLDKKADVNIESFDNGNTPWTLICGSPDHETVADLLLNAGADMNVTLTNGENPLYVSAAGGHTQAVRIMLKRGMDPSMATYFGWCPLVSFSQTISCGSAELTIVF